MPSPLPVTGAATIPDHPAITAPISHDRPAPPQPATADRAGQTAPSRPRRSPMELALRDRYKEGAEDAHFPYHMELNLFDRTFGEQLDGSKRRLTGDFPPKLQPHVSVEFLQAIRSRHPQSEAMQKVINRVLDPSAYELRYDHLPDEEPGKPRIPGYAVLHCHPPRTQDIPAVRLVLIYNPDTEEVTRIQLRNKDNHLIWNCAAPVASVTAAKRKRSDSDGEVDIVPQYEHIKPTETVKALLQTNPNIKSLALIEIIKGEKFPKSKPESDYLHRHLLEKKLSMRDFLPNLATFHLNAEAYLKPLLATDATNALTHILYPMEKAVFGLTPLKERFERAKIDVNFNFLRLIELKLIKRYISSIEAPQEEEIDAFIAVAGEIRNDENFPSFVRSLLKYRPMIYPLDGDEEMNAARQKMPYVFKDRMVKRDEFLVILPELRRRLSITKEELFSAISEWSSTSRTEDGENLHERIAKNLPRSTNFPVGLFMKQLADGLAEASVTASGASATFT